MTLHTSTSSQPGQMTTVMRAVHRPEGARVIRAALVRGGRVIDERVLARHAPVSVGPTERSTFVINGGPGPGSFRLLEWSGGGYVLHVVRGISGRVDVGGKIVELAADTHQRSIALGGGARGRVTVGDALLLFHFVDSVAPPSRARLPLAVQQGWAAELDWRTTCVAAFSFLIHFGAVGSIYSDWADPVIDESAELAHIVYSLPSAPPIPRVEVAPDPSTTANPSSTAEPATTAAPGAPKPGPGGVRGPAKPGGGEGKPMSDARALEIARQLAELGGTMVASLGVNAPGARGATDDVLRNSEVPSSMLDDVAARGTGTRSGSSIGLNLGTSIFVKPGAAGHGLPVGAGELAAVKHEHESGVVKEPKKPILSAAISDPVTTGGTVSDASRVVAGMRGGLRACYRRGLDQDPTMKGSVRVVASIGSNGEVRSVQASGVNGLSAEVVACVTGRVRSAQFSAPEGGAATVVIPMSFQSQ